MVAQIVDYILNQINQLERSEEIKKLLFLKLEMELVRKRCSIDIPYYYKQSNSTQIVKTNT